MLTDAALEGKIDRLAGLKENVIIGKLIPAATGLKRYRTIEIEPAEPLPRGIDDVGLLEGDELAAELGPRRRRGPGRLRPGVRHGRARGDRLGLRLHGRRVRRHRRGPRRVRRGRVWKLRVARVGAPRRRSAPPRGRSRTRRRGASRAAWYCREVELALPRWPAALDGLRVALFADLHAGAGHMTPARVAAVVDAAIGLGADVNLLLGDFLDSTALGQGRARVRDVAPSSRGSRDAAAVLGNHDWRAAGPAMRLGAAATPACGCSRTRRPSCGPACGWRGRRTCAIATPASPPRCAPVPEDAAVLLCTHDPDLFPRVPAARRADRRRAMSTAARSTSRSCAARSSRRATATVTLHGHVVEGGRHLYVSAGLGTAGPAAAPAPAARDSRPASHSRRAQRSSRVTCAARSPLAGSVRTSSVGPGARPPRPRRWRRSRRRSRRRGGRAPARASIAASFQWRAATASDRAKRRCGQPPGRPSSRGRCSSARSSQPVHQTHSNVAASRTSSGPAWSESRWGMPSTRSRAGRQGARRRSRTGR